MCCTHLEAEFVLAAGRDIRVLKCHFLQMLTTSSKRHGPSVLQEDKERVGSGNKSTVLLQKYFCVAGEEGREKMLIYPLPPGTASIE